MSSVFSSIITKFGLTEGNCNKEISARLLEDFSRLHGENWRLLTSQLNLKNIIVKDIERDCVREEEKRIEFFKRWKKFAGCGATYKTLILALLEINERSDAESLCQFLQHLVLTQHSEYMICENVFCSLWVKFL